MAEQVEETKDLSPKSMPQQGQGYIRNMDVMDEMVIGGISTSPQRISSLDRSGNSLDSLAPIFPPQNFEVPDINFSNSVISNADFNQSMLSSAQMYSNSNTAYTNVTASGGGDQPVGSSQQQQGHPNMGGQHISVNSQQQVGFFPSASRSPTGTSSSDDSDDLPLAQLAKRVISANSSSHAGTNASVPSPSAHLTDTTSMEGSPISGNAPKKAKQSKRKKKKDPNEPQKPVSAYALFFRDTQATIKGHNPSASFGEVSKIVASMWDQLDPEHKDVYKKKTEMAKKQYLKQLAAYRASQVSQSASASEDIDKSPSPPGAGGLSVGAMSGSTNFQDMTVAPSGSSMSVGMAGQVMSQHRPHIQQQSPPQLMMVPSQMQQHMHQQHLLQQQQINMNQASPSHQHSPSHEMSGPVYTSPPHMGPTSYQPSMMDHNNAFGFSDQDVNMEVAYPHCVRNGCKNHARDNPAWDSEYCSNDCVITHCRDIFKNWVASRSGSNTYPVK